MLPFQPSAPPPSTYRGDAALVLAGGGARGAYEVGVLSYIYGEFAKRYGTPHVDIVCGTSVGAINGGFLATILDEPEVGISRLRALWSELELEQVLNFGVFQAARLGQVLLGGSTGNGVFDVGPLTRIVDRNMRWPRLVRNLKRGVLKALTVSATHVSTGRPWVFVDRGPNVQLPTTMPPTLVVRPARIGPQHMMASAAIPIFFPPVPIQGDLFVDGGLRLNTPMSPAIHLGARRILVVSLAGMPDDPVTPAFAPGVYPGAAFLLGKVLNAFLLDHVSADFIELERWNRMIDDGVAIYGPEFVERMNERARLRGRAPRHRIHALAISPTEDIGRLAGEHLRVHAPRFGRLLGRGLARLLSLGEGTSSDLVSYLLFDGMFAQQLVSMGYEDARNKEDYLARFFFGDLPIGISSAPPPPGSIPPLPFKRGGESTS